MKESPDTHGIFFFYLNYIINYYIYLYNIGLYMNRNLLGYYALFLYNTNEELSPDVMIII